MGDNISRQLGVERSELRLFDRILQASSSYRSNEGDSRPLRSSETFGTRNRNPWPCRQESSSNSSSFRCPQSHSIKFLPGPEETESLETHPEPKTFEQGLYKDEEIQDGDVNFDNSNSVHGNVGNFYRPKGRLSPHSHPQRPPEISGLSLSGNRLQLSSSPVWPCNSTESIFKGDKSCPSLSPTERYSLICIPGRLAHSGKLKGPSLQRYPVRHSNSSRSRLGNKLAKIQHCSVTTDHVSRCSFRLQERPGFSNSRKSGGSQNGLSRGPFLKSSKSKNVAQIIGSNGKHGGNPSLLSAPNATNPVLCPSVLQTRHSPSFSKDSDVRGHPPISSLVDSAQTHSDRPPLCVNKASDDNHHGRLEFRLGRGMGNPLSCRTVVRRREKAAHKHTRTYSSPEGNPDLGYPPEGVRFNNCVRQLDNSCLSESPGRNQVAPFVLPDVGPTNPLPEPRHIGESESLGRETECLSGRSIQGEGGHERVVPSSNLGRLRLPVIRTAYSGPVRNVNQSQTPNVLQQVLPSTSLGDRCSRNVMGQSINVCLSSSVPHSDNPPQVLPVVRGHAVDSSMLAKPALVPADPEPFSGPPVSFPNERETPLSEERSDLPSGSGVPPPNSVEIVHERFQKEGVSRRAADVAVLARRHTTSKTYNSRLALFAEWAASRSVDPLEASLDDICNFFLHLFDNGRQVSTIKNYRSAIAAVHKGFEDGSSISNNQTVSSLLRGMFNKRPPKRRLAPSWSINDVLETLAKTPYEPLHRAPLDVLTAKTVFLVAAASARRRSEIHALSIKRGFIRFSPSGVYMLPDPSFLAKNQSMSFTPNPVFLPDMTSASSVREDKFVCPVRALKWYLDRTKHLRTSDSLFVIPRSPYSPASKDTISRWIVSLIAKHANPNDNVRAHDLRAHASSMAWFKGVPLQDILNAAAWKTPSSFVSNYLTNVISSDENFARSILGSSSGQVSDLPPPARC